MSILLEIKKKLEEQRTWFEIDHFPENEDDYESLTIETRENGDVGAEEFGEVDLIEGQRIVKFIKDNYPNVKVDIEPVDEWIIINVQMK